MRVCVNMCACVCKYVCVCVGKKGRELDAVPRAGWLECIAGLIKSEENVCKITQQDWVDDLRHHTTNFVFYTII